MEKVYQTDWLATIPIFYNVKTHKVSKNINNVIDFRNLEFHPEGLSNYLEFGYSVFGQSPVKNVKILQHSSKLTVKNRKLIISKLPDIFDKYRYKISDENEVIEMIEERIHNWENKVKGDIIIPTSGGYDSRLLNMMIKDKSRINSFTYGISENQSNSIEVVYAKELSKKLRTNWQQIKIGDFHKNFDKWDVMYGPSTHAHGMYHIEFYEKIKKKIGGGQPLLSGIIGDAWAGNVTTKPINSISDLSEIGYSHGINADKNQMTMKSGSDIKSQYFYENKQNFKNKHWVLVEAMRTKMILLSFLMSIPSSLGFKPWSPFLEPDIAFGMMNLPRDRRINRIWQKDYFALNGTDFESMGLNFSKNNTLNFQAIDNFKLEPLRVEFLKEIIKETYIEWINRNISKPSFLLKTQRAYYGMFGNPIFDFISKPFGLTDDYNIASEKINEAQSAYYAYLTLKPLEKLIKKRNES